MFKKAKTILHDGLGPLSEGLNHYTLEVPEVEALAQLRASVCAECPMFIIEPVPFLRVPDLKITILNNMMCNDCGCSLPLKTRQNVSICKYWANL